MKKKEPGVLETLYQSWAAYLRLYLWERNDLYLVLATIILSFLSLKAECNSN